MTRPKATLSGDPVQQMRERVGLAVTASYRETGDHFHEKMKDRRFTQEHARLAGFLPRAGELESRTSDVFKKSYTARKLRMFGHTDPLVYTGKTKRSTETVKTDVISSILTDGDGIGEVKVTYPQAKGFRRRSAYTQIDMRSEFSRVTPHEHKELGGVFAASIKKHIRR
ncbi:hypothetical protein [Planctomycetes bacterium TBK1r]|uniref:Phage virion morphogenesis family protein n=1 Tax=Stieleria magnilauensis TaxID=2527963 RepID=A0ABX5XNE3_9BACT|nr:hypothetical protein TBK1r_03460 [Planctomycetes bacterium TBK1r]